MHAWFIFIIWDIQNPALFVCLFIDPEIQKNSVVIGSYYAIDFSIQVDLVLKQYPLVGPCHPKSIFLLSITLQVNA